MCYNDCVAFSIGLLSAKELNQIVLDYEGIVGEFDDTKLNMPACTDLPDILPGGWHPQWIKRGHKNKLVLLPKTPAAMAITRKEFSNLCELNGISRSFINPLYELKVPFKRELIRKGMVSLLFKVKGALSAVCMYDKIGNRAEWNRYYKRYVPAEIANLSDARLNTLSRIANVIDKHSGK